MPDLLRLETSDWSLNVWSRDIAPSQKQLSATLAARQASALPMAIRLRPSKFKSCTPLPCIAEHELLLREPIFFENRSYEFEFTFSQAMDTAEIRHRLTSVCDAFRFTGSALRGTLNTGNDVGWLRLGLHYCRHGQWQEAALAFEVLPVKMVMVDDLEKINAAIDHSYPLWRFALAQKTDHELAQSRKPHERFPLLWLAQFAALRDALLKEIHYICNAPHNRLQTSCRTLRADRLRGRMGYRLEEKVAQALAIGDTQRRFKSSSQRLSVDTPENQFIRMVLEYSRRSLAHFASAAAAHNTAPDRERISPAFFAELALWQKQLAQRLAHPLFDEVSDFTGLERESLVLHQRAGYAGAYRIWQQLKLYLDVFGRHAAISVKPVSELYEIWCLLELRRQLLALGFEEQASHKALLQEKNLEKVLQNGLGASFSFSRSDGILLRLAHEPIFGKPSSSYNQIYSWNATQKPDILLEATFPNGEQIIWIFDAKYRIDQADKANTPDLAPDDALNQMHRYRDALIHLSQSPEGAILKSRPVIGAYVLYPGWHPQQDTASDNPYHKAIEAVGIGAFPALPEQANGWLAAFLLQHLGGKPSAIEYRIEAPDEYLAQDSVRIAPAGLYLRRNGQLVFVAPTGGGRTPAYLERFRQGTARWYHIPVDTINKQQTSHTIMQDIAHCAIAIHSKGKTSVIDYVYDVRSVKRVERSQISAEQAGSNKAAGSGQYWLFELGASHRLDALLQLNTQRPFKFKITSMRDLLSASNGDMLAKRYGYLYQEAGLDA
ncbi:DUF2357 domain-containing protein [Iodobacter sp.]|uniref:DUF2357 domain-containing protein n=1 Tax=Iodobacter sp. TaxID=1915058 RepID=UPI0025E5D43A|nr:DUF2357 domain-containing protein [Iodobacter sp.]